MNTLALTKPARDELKIAISFKKLYLLLNWNEANIVKKISSLKYKKSELYVLTTQ